MKIWVYKVCPRYIQYVFISLQRVLAMQCIFISLQILLTMHWMCLYLSTDFAHDTFNVSLLVCEVRSRCIESIFFCRVISLLAMIKIGRLNCEKDWPMTRRQRWWAPSKRLMRKCTEAIDATAYWSKYNDHDQQTAFTADDGTTLLSIATIATMCYEKLYIPANVMISRQQSSHSESGTKIWCTWQILCQSCFKKRCGSRSRPGKYTESENVV